MLVVANDIPYTAFDNDRYVVPIRIEHGFEAVSLAKMFGSRRQEPRDAARRSPVETLGTGAVEARWLIEALLKLSQHLSDHFAISR
jgi:hypothetical protein